MILENNDKFTLSKNLILKARKMLKVAFLLKNQDDESASNRLYYALFYATNAILILKGLSAKKHSGVKRFFDLYFVKSGLIDKKFSKIFEDVREIREESDYNFFYEINKAEVDRNFARVEEFIDYMEVFISKVMAETIKI